MLRLRAALCFLPLLVCVGQLISTDAKEYNRNDFPVGFIFGASTSAYQVEGAAFEDGRTPSSADGFAHSGQFVGNGVVACDQYHKYKEDVQLMVDTGLDAYRFSISWSRLIPNGRGPINTKGLEYYNNLINELVCYGIQPHVTLFQQDLPLALEDEYGGFSNPKIVEDFTAYADVCFREFGDRVKHWSSINEANLFAITLDRVWRWPIIESYDSFLIGHHVLLAHASAARLYKEKYQAKQHGFVGIDLYAYYFVPFSNSTENIMATKRSYTFFIDWFMHPLMYGDYPEMMKTTVGASLPIFTKGDSESLQGSFDFIALNYYSAIMAKNSPSRLNETDSDHYKVATWICFNGTDPLLGEPIANTPWGLQGVLEHFKHVYNNPPIFIYENGQSTNYNISVDDLTRVEYLNDHVCSLLESVRNGSNTKGYFVWSFLDVFEFLYGYERSLGLYYVDFNDPKLSRYPKLSQKWYSSFLKGGSIIATGRGSKEDNGPTFLQMSPRTSEC